MSFLFQVWSRNVGRICIRAYLVYFKICTELGLCAQAYEEVEDSLEDDLSQENVEDVNDRPYCMMCEYVVGEIDRYVTDNRTEESIQEAVEQICHLLR